MLHDFRHSTWGHAINVIQIEDEGQKLTVVGHGQGIEAGHVIVIKGKGDDGKTVMPCYRVDQIKYFRDPIDQFSASLSWMPSSELDATDRALYQNEKKTFLSLIEA